jgi:signal transduction histidine kinase
MHRNIRIMETNQVARHKFKKELKTLVDKIHHDNSANKILKNDVKVFVSSPEIISEQWIEHLPPSEDGKSKQLINNIQWVLVICCFIALILAYWLSGQFNKPLKSLSLGFRKLAQGDYQHHVDETGVKEMRETIRHFNATVIHLDELTLAAKHHSEIAHLAELGEVSRGLAHALRNPIHTIGLSIEQLSDEDLTENQRILLIKTVQNKIHHIDKNIKALLTLTTTGVQRDDHVPVLAVIQDILLEYKSCQNRPQTFITDVEPSLEIIGAESEIRSIFHTLIINACEANPINGLVNISAKDNTDGVIILNVIDQGKGIDPAIADKLFQPHISTKPEGAGMGIYIAHRIINLHYHGDIVLKNAIPNGCEASATFNIKEV